MAQENKDQELAHEDSDVEELDEEMKRNEDPDVVKPHPEDVLLTWVADEYLHHERTVLWYLVGFIITILLVFYAVVTAAWTMAVAVALMGAVVYLYSHEPPEMKEIVITKLGVHFGNKYFPFHQLSSFWIVNEPSYKALVLEEVNHSTDIVILLPFDTVSEVRDILIEELPENEGKKEALVDRFGRFMKI